MYRLATLTALTLIFFLTTLPALAQQARFERLGAPTPTGTGLSVSTDMTPDGSTIVGYSDAPDGGDWVAFRWQDGEMEAIDRIPGSGVRATNATVSDDGSVVAGYSFINAQGFRAWRWENGEIRVIHDPEECQSTYLMEVSADGSVSVGWCQGEDEGGAIRWVDGEIEHLGQVDTSLSGGKAYAVSPDGSTVVGRVPIEDAEGGGNKWGPMHWTEENGMGLLWEQTSGFAAAKAMTPDGSIIIGDDDFSLFPSTGDVWRWEEGVGRQQLATPEEFTKAQVWDVSDDGSIIVGYVHQPVTGGTRVQPMIWTEETDMRNLREVLENDFGLDLTGFGENEMYAQNISADGTVISGYGDNPDGVVEAWRAEAPFGQPIADEATPEALADVLSAPSPNPVSGISTFTIAVEQGQHVSVEVFDALGRQVQTVYDGALAAGMSERLTLDASALPAGVYVVRATGEDFVKTQRVTVVR